MRHKRVWGQALKSLVIAVSLASPASFAQDCGVAQDVELGPSNLSPREASAGSGVVLSISGSDKNFRIGPWTEQLQYRLKGVQSLDRSQVRVALHSRHFSEDVTSDFSISASGDRLVMLDALKKDLAEGARNTGQDAVLIFNFVTANYDRSYSFEQPIRRADSGCT